MSTEPMILIALIIAVVAFIVGWRKGWIIASRRSPPAPKPTGETYVPKNETDLPGWER